MERGLPVRHLRVGLGAAEQPIGARALEELLEAAVRMGEGEVDVLADDIEETREAIARLGEAHGGLRARRDVGEDAPDSVRPSALRSGRARSRRTRVTPSTPSSRY